MWDEARRGRGWESLGGAGFAVWASVGTRLKWVRREMSALEGGGGIGVGMRSGVEAGGGGIV